MSFNETIGDISRDVCPEKRADIFINDSLNHVRQEIDLTMKTAFLSNEPISDLALSRPAPSLSKYVMRNRPNWQATMATYGVSYNNRCVCDPLEFSGPECDSVLEDVRKMCNVNVKTGYDETARNSIVTATNAPAMAALNTISVKRVLVCGMDKQGADLKRIQMAMHLHNVKESTVDVVDWMASENRVLWPDLPGIRIRSVVSDMGLLFSTLLDIEADPRYDLILLNHTFSSFAHFDIEHILDLLRWNRARGYECDMVGIYWDPFEMFMSSIHNIDPITRHFSYEGETLIKGVRYNQFKMLNTRYCDPVIDSDALRQRFLKEGFTVEQWHASRYIQRYEGFRPDIFKKVKLLGGLRVFTVKTYGELPTISFEPYDRLNRAYAENAFKGAMSMDLTDMSIMASFPVKKNKGRHWIGRDSMYIGPDILVGEKHNGVHFQALVQGGMGRFVTGLGGFTLSIRLSGLSVHYFEGEVILKKGWEEAYPGRNSKRGSFLANWIERIIVFDGIVAGVSHYASFIDRWSKIVTLFNREPDVFNQLKLQHYYSHPTPQDLDRIWERSEEGIVIQPACSPAGAFKDGLGSARYIKKDITYEKKIGGEIYEVKLNGDVVRKRPDRTLESTAAEITLIREYWTYQEFFIFYRVMRNLNDPNGWRYPILRSVKEYLMALEGVHEGFDMDDIIEDIYKAYLSVYGGELKVGAIANVGVLIKEIDQKWRTVLSQGDFYRITGGDIGVCDRLVQEIENKMTISVPGCPKCRTFVSDKVSCVIMLKDATTIHNTFIDDSRGFKVEEHMHWIVSIPAFRAFLGATSITYGGNTLENMIDHWFLLKGLMHKDGLRFRYVRPIGEIRARKFNGKEEIEESLLESIELFECKLFFEGRVVDAETRKMMNFIGEHELISVNIVLDCNERDEHNNRAWYRPVIYKKWIDNERIRCLGDMLRYFSYKLNCDIVAGISKD